MCDGAQEAMAFSPDDSELLTRGTNHFLRAFEVATGAARTPVPGGALEGPISHAALSPNGKILAVGWTDGTISFFNAKTGVLAERTAPIHGSFIFRLVFSPDGQLLAKAGAAQEPLAMIWDTANH